MSTAVLFDLDDTLVDLQYSRRHGLLAVQEILPELKRVPLEELELVHDEELKANYLRTLDDSLSDDEARLEHMRGICRHYDWKQTGWPMQQMPTCESNSQIRDWFRASRSCLRPYGDG